MTTVSALWEDAEAAYPENVAVVAAERVTYSSLGRRIRSAAAALHAGRGVGRGDVVAVVTPNCLEFVIAYFAILRLGATIQPVDQRLTADELRRLLGHSGAQTIIAHATAWPKVDEARRRLPDSPRIVGIGIDASGVDRFDDQRESNISAARLTPSDIAELMYTSGTTGEPKGVLRSHANVRAAVRNSTRGFGYRSGDIILIVMPLSHSSALNSQLLPLLSLGGTVVILEGFDVGGVIAAIRREQVTCMRAVPAMLRLLLTAPEFRADALPSLRLLVNSSAPIDPATYAALKDRFAGIEVMNSYGLTEASTSTVLPDSAAYSHAASIGHPIDGVEMCVMAADGQLVGDDMEGEIAIRGLHVFAGYHGAADATRAAVAGGWLHTGDLGHRDGSGYYYLHGRKDDVINIGGHKVAPLEVERCILQLSEVAEAAVVGMPHRVLGQVVRAFVVPRDPATFEARSVIRHCARQLPSYKVPFVATVLPELPRNSVGKVARQQLRDLDGRPDAAGAGERSTGVRG